MSEKLELYLEEIGHFLSDREERKEILSEIRSHILEKAEQEYGQVTEASISEVIAAYGQARHVAEKYMGDRQVIAPVFQRYLFRYTALLFAFHFVLIVVAAIFKKSFFVLPVFYMPPMGSFEALFYLPTAFLFDLGVVSLILYLVTQSKKEVKLPWPRFSIDIDEVRQPKRKVRQILWLAFMMALMGMFLYFYIQYGTIFFSNFSRLEPLFTPQAGQWASLIVMGLWAIGSICLAIKLWISSPWINVVDNALSLILLGFAFSLPWNTALANPFPEPFNRITIMINLPIILLVICIFVSIELIKAFVRIGRKSLAKQPLHRI